MLPPQMYAPLKNSTIRSFSPSSSHRHLCENASPPPPERDDSTALPARNLFYMHKHAVRLSGQRERVRRVPVHLRGRVPPPHQRKRGVRSMSFGHLPAVCDPPDDGSPAVLARRARRQLPFVPQGDVR